MRRCVWDVMRWGAARCAAESRNVLVGAHRAIVPERWAGVSAAHGEQRVRLARAGLQLFGGDPHACVCLVFEGTHGLSACSILREIDRAFVPQACALLHQHAQTPGSSGVWPRPLQQPQEHKPTLPPRPRPFTPTSTSRPWLRIQTRWLKTAKGGQPPQTRTWWRSCIASLSSFPGRWTRSALSAIAMRQA